MAATASVGTSHFGFHLDQNQARNFRIPPRCEVSEYIGLAVTTHWQIPLMNISPLKVGLDYMFFRELKALTGRHQRLYLVACAAQVPGPVCVYKSAILSSRIQITTDLTTENAI